MSRVQVSTCRYMFGSVALAGAVCTRAAQSFFVFGHALWELFEPPITLTNFATPSNFEE